MKILACDTSCDETSVAVVEDDRVLANKLSSQIQSHKEWGGVVPSLAKRKHEELIDLVISRALKQAKVHLEDIDIFAVTKGPGLAIALEVGIRKMKELALTFQKPLIAVNHMEGHVYSALAKNSKGKPQIEYTFPLLVLLISGGHTELVLMKGHGKYDILGQTLDDSIGEAYDKVGRMLDMGYPAGSVLEKIAQDGDENKYLLPIPMRHSGDGNMSYSGLKTAAMKLVNEELKEPLNKYGEKFRRNRQSSASENRLNNFQTSELNLQPNNPRNSLTAHNLKQITCDISASFQKAAVEQLIIKTDFILNKLSSDLNLKISDLIIAGGVSQNRYLRKKFKQKFAKKLRIYYPTDKKLYTDNAGMIGVAAFFNALQGNFVKDIESLDRNPNWRIDDVTA